MSNASWRRILCDLLSLPTAPFAERYLIEYITRFCAARRSAKVTVDGVGNLLVRVKRGNPRVPRPVCLTAHLDHPGFIALKMKRNAGLIAEWRGGVKPEYFVGTGVRFFDEGRWIRGVIRKIDTVRTGAGTTRKVKTAEVEIRRPVPPGAVGMWDIPDPRIREHRIYARGCDDVAGAAALLGCLDQLDRQRQPVDAYFLFTRAEEVGFIGALHACRLGTIPKKCIVVAVENSSEIPGVRMGNGPILRVGDKSSIFTPQVTAFCGSIAEQLMRTQPGFKFQRKLMDGGTCESSAYCQRGYDATGICIALGNYHNMNVRRKRIGPEYVDLRDFENMVRWFVELCQPGSRFDAHRDGLARRLDKLEREYGSLIRRTTKGEGL